MNEPAIGRAIRKAEATGGQDEALEVLLNAGIRVWFADVKSHTVFYSSDVTTYAEYGRPVAGADEMPAWSLDPEGIRSALQGFESGEFGREDFLRLLWDAGVIDYEVNLLWRETTFYGLHGESHVVQSSLPLPRRRTSPDIAVMPMTTGIWVVPPSRPQPASRG